MEGIDTTPQLSEIGDEELFVNNRIDIELGASDEDGEKPRLQVFEGLKEGMEFQNETGRLSWAPTKNDVGVTSIGGRSFQAKELSMRKMKDCPRSLTKPPCPIRIRSQE